MSHNDDGFFLSEKSSKARIREAENARKNRAEILKAFSQGKVTRRELVKWGLITTGGMLAPIHGLNPFVNSAYASGGGGNIGNGIPTGAPASPTFGVQPFSTPMPRFDVAQRIPNPLTGGLTPVPQAQSNQTQQPLDPALVNGQTGLTGPVEGRPPGP
ncbi:MAG: copper oxidase, partial [Candidatus Angelobacter sp.]